MNREGGYNSTRPRRWSEPGRPENLSGISGGGAQTDLSESQDWAASLPPQTPPHGGSTSSLKDHGPQGAQEVTPVSAPSPRLVPGAHLASSVSLAPADYGKTSSP